MFVDLENQSTQIFRIYIDLFMVKGILSFLLIYVLCLKHDDIEGKVKEPNL